MLISKLNQLNHIQQFPDHDFRNVVRPNNDTSHSIASLDLGDGPLILSVPDTQGRYYGMPLMDADLIYSQWLVDALQVHKQEIRLL